MIKEKIELAISIVNLMATGILSYMAFSLSKKYSKKSQNLNEDAIFHQLFRDFNERYNKVNNTLNHLELNPHSLEELKKNEERYNDILDFFNICAEEYFWHKKGRIVGKVWNAWDKGMNYWYNEVPVIKEAWEDEIKKNGCKSYYIENENDFFK